MLKKTSLFLFIFFLLSSLSIQAFGDSSEKLNSEKLNKEQKKELYEKGVITDSKGREWNIKVVPGTENICLWSKNGFKDCKKTFEDLGTKDFWKGVGNDIKRSALVSKTAVWDFAINGCRKDFSKTLEKNNELDEQAMGSGLLKFLNWTKFGLKTSGRVIATPFGVLAGGVGLIVLPTFDIALKPIIGIYQGLGRGILSPGVAFIWNGSAYILLINKDVPTKESTHLVSLNTKNNRNTIYIDQNTLEVLLKQSILTVVDESRQKPLRDEIRQSYKKANSLRDQCDELSKKFKEENPKREKLIEDPSVTNFSTQLETNTDVKVKEGWNSKELIKKQFTELKDQGILNVSEEVDLDLVVEELDKRMKGMLGYTDAELILYNGDEFAATHIPADIKKSEDMLIDPAKEVLDGAFEK